ncbi:hypothetical protein [Nodularia spumigena]|nr:hypothetical protein [Nodularia spumigena]
MSVTASENQTELGSLVGVNRTVAQLYTPIYKDLLKFGWTKFFDHATFPD